MKKIEKDMLAAIARWESWLNGDTQVVVHHDKGRATVYLFGNRIATVNLFGVVTPDKVTMWGFPTRTTASRMRALGFDAHIKDGVMHVEDYTTLPVRITPSEWAKSLALQALESKA